VQPKIQQPEEIVLSDSEKIHKSLIEYTELEKALEAARQEFQNCRFELLTDEVRAKMVEIDQQEKTVIDEINKVLATMKVKLVEATKKLGESVNTPKGIRSAIWSEIERWDSKGLDGYAVAHPEILQLRSKDIVISIR
jgi:hypothetical protein